MKTDGHPSLANVMDLLLDAICVVDTQGRFVFVSAACERIFGYAPHEMIGRPMIDFVFSEDRARTLNAVDEIVAGVHKPHFENRYLRKDGGVVHIMWSARWSEVDQVRVAVARDVTERKRSESVQAALYAISEAAFAAEDLLALFHRIHQIIDTLLPAINFFVALYDKDRGELSFPYFVDEHDTAPAPLTLDSGTLSAEVVRTGRALLLTPTTRAALPAGCAATWAAIRSTGWACRSSRKRASSARWWCRAIRATCATASRTWSCCSSSPRRSPPPSSASRWTAGCSTSHATTR